MSLVQDLLAKLQIGESTTIACAGSKEADREAVSTLLQEVQRLQDAGLVIIGNSTDRSIAFTLLQKPEPQ
jgi:hypothetical protein